MEFQEVIKEAGRCCAFYKHNCGACSLTNVCPVRFFIDEYINVGNDTYFEGRVMEWVKEHPAPVYPSIAKYLERFGITIRRDGSLQADFFKANEPMSAYTANLLGISLEESENEKTD